MSFLDNNFGFFAKTRTPFVRVKRNLSISVENARTILFELSRPPCYNGITDRFTTHPTASALKVQRGCRAGSGRMRDFE